MHICMCMCIFAYKCIKIHIFLMHISTNFNQTISLLMRNRVWIEFFWEFLFNSGISGVDRILVISFCFWIFFLFWDWHFRLFVCFWWINYMSRKIFYLLEMPRIKSTKAPLIKPWISSYAKDLTTDGEIVYCVICKKKYSLW